MQKCPHRGALSILAVLILALAAGCGSPTQVPAPVLPSETEQVSTPTSPPTATETALPPTETASPSPLPPTATLTRTPTPLPSPTATATATPTLTLVPATGRASSSLPSPSESGIKIYFVQLDTGGTVGCGDSVIAVGSGVKKTGDVTKDVKAGLESLFSNKWDYSGALYNPLFRSKISVQHVNYDDGLISVHLSGDYNPSGDDCDNTRVKAQIWSTIRQFRDVERTNIFLNQVPFGDRLSNDK